MGTEFALKKEYGACGKKTFGAYGVPGLSKTFTIVQAVMTGQGAEVYNNVSELVGVAYLNAGSVPEGTTDFGGIANGYKGGCVDGSEWHKYPCSCVGVYTNNTMSKISCEVKVGSDTVLCTGSYALKIVR